MKSIKKFNEMMFSNPDGSSISVRNMRHTPSSAAKHLGDSESEKQLKKGIKVESEHCDIYEELEEYLFTHNIQTPWSKEEFYEKIAKSHIKEIPDYYDRLEKMEINPQP